jgi:hypothetical protein
MNLILAAGMPDSAAAVEAIRTFVGPIFIGILGFIALNFLFRRQLTQFFQFFAIAVLVGVFFWSPLTGGVVKVFADWMGSLFG